MKGRQKEDHVHGDRSSIELSPKAWPEFDRFFTANGGVWGGCFCMFFHRTGEFDAGAYAKNRAAKREITKKGMAHGTIVYCGKDPVGWCQYGPKEELPRVDRKRGYSPTGPDAWRITCLFISRGHRRLGFADLAVKDSVRVMKRQGVKTIEAYPVEGKLTATFLWSGTPSLFHGAGFKPLGPLGRKSWLYSLSVR